MGCTAWLSSITVPEVGGGGVEAKSQQFFPVGVPRRYIHPRIDRLELRPKHCHLRRSRPKNRSDYVTRRYKSGGIVHPPKIATLWPHKVGHSVTVQHCVPLAFTYCDTASAILPRFPPNSLTTLGSWCFFQAPLKSFTWKVSYRFLNISGNALLKMSFWFWAKLPR
jgi:hypothetical protein